jgi:hypothetical protein
MNRTASGSAVTLSISEEKQQIISELVARGCEEEKACKAADLTFQTLRAAKLSPKARFEMAAGYAGYGIFNPLPKRQKVMPVQDQPIIPNMPPVSDDAPSKPDEAKKKRKPRPEPQPQATFLQPTPPPTAPVGIVIRDKRGFLANVSLAATLFVIAAYYFGMKVAAIFSIICYFVLTFL